MRRLTKGDKRRGACFMNYEVVVTDYRLLYSLTSRNQEDNPQVMFRDTHFSEPGYAGPEAVAVSSDGDVMDD